MLTGFKWPFPIIVSSFMVLYDMAKYLIILTSFFLVGKMKMFLTLKDQHHKLVKHTKTICRQQPTNCLNVFDHFVELALKGLNAIIIGPLLLSFLSHFFLLNIFFATAISFF